MASIQTGIELHDNFTSVLYNMCSAVDYAVNNFSELEGVMNSSVTAQAYENIENQAVQLGNEIQQNTQSQNQFNQAVNNGGSGFDNLISKAMRLATAYMSIQTAEKALGISDELTQTIARLNLMNDGTQTTQELFDKIYISAQKTHSPLMETANAIAKMGNNAGAAFSGNDELIAFMEQVNKQFVIGGASATEQSNAMLQLSQAMASGALRGDELNSILDAAPGIARTIEESMGWAEGSIKSYAEQGQVTAEVVKSSLLNMADETNAAFESMPITFSQAMTDFISSVQRAFQPVLQRLNDIANSDTFQNFVNGAIEAMAALANIVLNIFDLIGTVGGFIADNWSIISPIVYGVVAALAAYLLIAGIVAVKNAIMSASQAVHAAAAMMAAGATFAQTAAQYGLNAALAACPLTWIILLIIALIAVIFAVCNAIAKMTGIANSGFGVITGGVNVVIQFFKNLGLTVANIALGIGNAIAALGVNIMTAFHNAICSVQAWWYDLLSTGLTVIAGICEALNKLPFVEFDYSGITSAADDYAAKSAEAAGNKEDYQSISDAFNEGMSTFDTFQDGWVSDAFNAGAEWGDGIADAVSNFSLSDIFGGTDIPNGDGYTSGFDSAIDNAMNNTGIPDNLDNISGDTSNISDAMDITSEELKYLRDIAEQEAVNRYTVAEITIDQSGMQNIIKNGMDLDGVVSGLTDAVNEAVDSITEGVHE